MSNHRSEALQSRTSSTRNAVEEEEGMSVDFEFVDRQTASSAHGREASSATEVRESLRTDAAPKGPRQPERSSRHSTRAQTEITDPKRSRRGPSGSQPLTDPPSSSKSIFSLSGIVQVLTGSSPASEEEHGAVSSAREVELADAGELHDYATNLEAMLSENRKALDGYRDKFQQMEVERSEMIKYINDLAARNRKLEDDLQQKSALLESRTVELRTAESFLTKYDDIPGDEIVNLVSDLNQQVLGVAAKCDELVKFKRVSGDKIRTESVKKYHHDLLPFIAHTLCQHLESMDNNEDPTLFQLAIQAALLAQISDFLRNWPLSPNRSFSSNLWKLYDLIHENELQAVASRWRALCSKYLRVGQKEDVRAHRDHTEFSVEIITKILYCAGATLGSSELVELCRKKLGDDVNRLWHSAAQLAMKTKESVLSTDYEVIIIPPGSDFDSSIAQSQGSQGQKARSSSGKVLCTTDLGLIRSTSSPKQGNPTKSGLDKVITMKATIVFEHEILAMLSSN